MTTIYAQGQFARPYFVSAGVPGERLALLRKAFLDTWKDKETLKDAAKLKFKIDPLSGTALQKLVDDINALPDSFIEKFKKAVEFKQAKAK
jgi:hypothetical protein